MKSYGIKLIDLLKREMDSPQPSRMQYENNTINATGISKEDINYIVDSSVSGDFNIKIRGDKHLLDIDKGTNNTIASVEDIAKWIIAKPVNYRGATQNQSLQSLGVGSPKVLALAKRIVKSLALKGIKPTNFISRTVEKHMANLKVIAPIVEDVKKNVQELLTQAGFDLKGKTIKFK